MTINSVTPEQFFSSTGNDSYPTTRTYFHFKDLNPNEFALLETFIRAIQNTPIVELEEKISKFSKQ